ncbi:hypothetical protein, partial [Amycolatopsis sp. CA-128772]|uniref:hypothetical protein n=1 Tax=Amycolatopsis sp. CA-128772 TaxID=2073159 RepID=UPI000CD1AFE8
MRLVRLERQRSRVADDVRAALASLGRGSTMIGGIALIGVGSVTDRPIEAVVLLPHGVIIVIGVDLPDPALRLEAPLGGPWQADGWPLVTDEDAVNPATEALDLSQACERRIADLVPGTAPVGTIIAVGPYVETVDQPAADLAGPVRVLHPTPTTMLAATVSLATAHRPRSVDQVRALIRGLAPSAPEFSDEVLLGEGFSRLTDDAPPESLWDDGSEALPPAAAGSAPAGVGSAGVSDWRTETPVAAVVAESPAAEGEGAEVLPPASDSPALPVFPGPGYPVAPPAVAEAPPAVTEVSPAMAEVSPAMAEAPPAVTEVSPAVAEVSPAVAEAPAPQAAAAGPATVEPAAPEGPAASPAEAEPAEPARERPAPSAEAAPTEAAAAEAPVAQADPEPSAEAEPPQAAAPQAPAAQPDPEPPAAPQASAAQVDPEPPAEAAQPFPQPAPEPPAPAEPPTPQP